MELKRDDNGVPVLVDGKPVYRHPDGQEAPFDAQAALGKIRELSAERDKQLRENAELAGELARFQERFQGIDDPESARQAVSRLASQENAASRVEAEKNRLKSGLEKRISELGDALGKKEAQLREILVESRFATSPSISERTVLPPDIAATYFGKHFKVEEGERGPQVVGYLQGEKILSRERPGEAASFEEAMAVILDAHPLRDRILKGVAAGGSGAAGHGGGGGGRDSRFTRREWQKKLSEAPPKERQELLRQAAAGKIHIQ